MRHAIIAAQETEAYKEINPTEEEERERPTVVESCKNKRHGKYNDRIDQIDDQGEKLRTLYQNASMCLILLTALLKKISTGIGAEYKMAPLKGLWRVLEKTVMRPKEGVPWDIVSPQTVTASVRQSRSIHHE